MVYLAYRQNEKFYERHIPHQLITSIYSSIATLVAPMKIAAKVIHTESKTLYKKFLKFKSCSIETGKCLFL